MPKTGNAKRNLALQKQLGRKRMTYDGLAKAAEVSKATVIRAALGNRLRMQTAVRIADVLQSTPEELQLV